jgi:hypothetical protein
MYAFILSLLLFNAGFELLEGVKVESEGKPISIEIGHLVPCVADWDGDGKKDLIVGQFSGGKVRLYLNKGSDEAPEFKGFEYMTAGGKEISLPSG